MLCRGGGARRRCDCEEEQETWQRDEVDDSGVVPTRAASSALPSSFPDLFDDRGQRVRQQPRLGSIRWRLSRWENGEQISGSLGFVRANEALMTEGAGRVEVAQPTTSARGREGVWRGAT